MRDVLRQSEAPAVCDRPPWGKNRISVRNGAPGSWRLSPGKLVASPFQHLKGNPQEGRFHIREGKLPYMGCGQAQILGEARHQGLGHQDHRQGAACLPSGLTIPTTSRGTVSIHLSFLSSPLPSPLPPSTKSGLCVHPEPDSALGNLPGGCSGKAHGFPVSVRKEKQAWKSAPCQGPVTAPPSDTLSCFLPDRELPPSSRTTPCARPRQPQATVLLRPGGKLQLPSWLPWC